MKGWRIITAVMVLGLFLPAGGRADEATTLDAIRRLADTGQIDQALRRLEAFLAQHPTSVQGRFLQGLIFVQQHQVPQAIAVFKALTRDHPELPEPYNNLAVLYASQGDFDKARAALSQAINTHPSYARAHENLGNVYARMARMAYNRALELDQDNKTTQLKLALINRLFRLHQSGAEGTDGSSNGVHSPPSSTGSASPPAPRQTASAVTRQIVDTVRAWARAWSAQDVEAYLAFYAPDFVPPHGLSRQAWRERRGLRLRAPRRIRVTIQNPDVVLLTDTLARVRFEQLYVSDTYRDRSEKLLLLTKHGANWRILEEWAR